jgi:hypothetical protein
MLFSYAIEGSLGWGFFGFGETRINAHTLPGQTEGLRVGCGGKNKVFIKPLALGWMGGV